MAKNSKENPKFLLYELKENPRKLEETILREKGIKEKYIQNLFKENLAKVFDLIYLEDEHYLINPDTGEKDCRADALAFSKKGGYFVVIEYKRDKSLELYEQAAGYISCLKDTKNPECVHNGHELISILKDKEKSQKRDYKNVLWKETKGICIATEIDKRLRHHQRPDEQKDENIKIVEIKFYDDKKILYIDTSNLPEWLAITSSKNTRNNNKEYLKTKSKQGKVENRNDLRTIDDILNIDWIKPEIKGCFQRIDKILSPQRKKWLGRQVSSSNINKPYTIINYLQKSLKKILFSVVVRKSQINIYGTWLLELHQNLSELLGKHSVKHKKENHIGTGDWHFPPIKNKNDFSEIKAFIQEYKEQFSENKEIFK